MSDSESDSSINKDTLEVNEKDLFSLNKSLLTFLREMHISKIDVHLRRVEIRYLYNEESDPYRNLIIHTDEDMF